jgi:hypothetical protein
VVTITGFTAPGVTITVCGNEARRGSADCNMTASEGRGLDRDGNPTVASLPVNAPPAPCPCVIRVSTASNDQIAVVPIRIVGHPTAPVESADVPERVPLDVSIVVNESNDGFADVARASLGGAGTYEAMVTVRNRTTEPIERIRLDGSAGRDTDEQLVVLELDAPTAMQAGETFSQTVSAEIPALVFGEVEWRVAVSGAGPTVTATDTTRAVPWLLWTLGAILVIDLLILLARLAFRFWRRERGDWEPDDNPFRDELGEGRDGPNEYKGDPIVADDRQDRQLVG